MIEDVVATLLRGFTLFRGETGQLPLAVLAWMWAMRVVFLASIVFLPRAGAVATLATMLATAVLRFYVKGLYPDLPAPFIGALTHIVLWSPLVVFLLYSMRGRRAPGISSLERAYPDWLAVVIAMMAVSLVFDVREVVTALV